MLQQMLIGTGRRPEMNDIVLIFTTMFPGGFSYSGRRPIFHGGVLFFHDIVKSQAVSFTIVYNIFNGGRPQLMLDKRLSMCNCIKELDNTIHHSIRHTMLHRSRALWRCRYK